MKQGINCLKDNRRRMYYIGKAKKYSKGDLAKASQKALHLPTTGNFDERTVIRINQLSDKSFANLKELTNKNLQNN